MLAAIVLPLLRQPGVPSWNTIWVEDGVIYTQQANAAGPFHVLFRSYAGYLQLIPRLLAVPTAYLPGRDLAVYLAVSSAVVCGLAAAFVYRSTLGWIESVPIRLALATMVVLGPAVAIETTATITNSIWILLAVLPWAFLSVLEKRRDVAMRATVAFIVATSTVLAAVYLPLAVWLAVKRRTRGSIASLAALSVGLVVQLAVVTRAQFAPRSNDSLRLLVDFFGLPRARVVPGR